MPAITGRWHPAPYNAGAHRSGNDIYGHVIISSFLTCDLNNSIRELSIDIGVSE